ncbi:helix-turn-helix domain-containing protein [Sphaerisporangium sp. NPDC051011]|uniref:sigma-54-dependent Fis family transcriptional regulator n=1 Tax=Sphaerisporangium sp. NPDC051011 TaxID=3155792 RepID=UPI0033EEFF48
MSSAARSPRQAIKASWYRSELAGLDPSHALETLAPDGVAAPSLLLEASEPVLHELGATLRDTGYATLLVDRECRLVHRTCGRKATATAFDGVGVDLGASLLEAHIGTNAPGTALETHQPVVINGAEHFAEGLKEFSCFGYPIRHPLTRRVEGVLDISSLSSDANPLLRPVVEHAVRDIERRLHERSHATDARLMAAYQEAALRTRSALVAFGDDMTVSNRAAEDLLTSADITHLRLLTEELPRSTSAPIELRLASGQPVRVHATLLGTRRPGALLKVEPRDERRVISQPASEAPGHARDRTTLLVTGAPGSGRTTRARSLATGSPVTVLNAAEALLDGDQDWGRRFQQRMSSPAGTVILDGIELLSDVLVDVITQQIEGKTGPQIVMVAGPRDLLPDRTAALAALATRYEETLPLLARRDEILGFARQMLDEIAPGMFLTPAAEKALASHNWPGNLRELRAALAFAVGQRCVGAISVQQLPPGVTSEPATPPSRRPLDQAERHIILHTLRTFDGNKARTAKELGISRTTLYAKMRAHRISQF